MDLVDKILKFEDGEMNDQETLEFMIELRDFGMLPKLQGFYGRTAHALGVI